MLLIYVLSYILSVIHNSKANAALADLPCVGLALEFFAEHWFY